MNRERAKRREEIAARMMAALCSPQHTFGSWEDQAHDALAMAEALMAKLDEAALADAPDADPMRQLAELQDLQEAKDAAANRSVAKSILIRQRDRQIAELEEQLAALNEFVEGVLNEASKSPELYGPFVRLVQDLDAKVGAK